jgi:HEAT repeat protein
LLALLGVGAFFAWRHLRGPRETLIGGKAPDTWLEQLRSPDPVVGTNAAESLADLGEPALPVLLKARKESDLRAHRRAVSALVRIGAPAAPGLVAVLEHGSSRVETALVRMGPAAIPELEKTLASVERAPTAARVLGAMGERGRSAAPALIGLVQDTAASDEARAAAAAALGLIGPEKPPAGDGTDIVGVLASALAGPPLLRVQAARALGQIGPPAQTAIASLSRLAGDTDVHAASVACEALGQIGGPSGAAPLVTRLLKSDGASKPAALALSRLGPAARLAVAPLISALKSHKQDGGFARAVLERLGEIAVPDLESALKEPDAATRQGAAEVLGLMGPRAASAVPGLLLLLADRDPRVAISAAQALIRIDPTKASPAVPMLVRLFKLSDEKVATPARVTLADFGPEARAAVPELLASLKSKDDTIVRRSAYVLGRLRPPEAAAALRSALSGPVGRSAVVQALGRLGEVARPAVPELLAVLKEDPLRAQAALALVRIAPQKSEQAVRALADDLAGENPRRDAALAVLLEMSQVPAEVAAALRPLLGDRLTVRPALRIVPRLEPKSAEVLIPDLITLLSSMDPEIRQEAGWLLRLIGKPALPALKRALSSPSPTVRSESARTLDWSPFCGPAKEPAFLLPLLEDKVETVRQSAAATCAGLGVRSAESVQIMLDLLGSTEKEMRVAAVHALRIALREQPERLAPYLIECLYDPDKEVRQATAETLRFAEGLLPAKARAALKDALLDQSPAVRLSAADTLAYTGAAGEAELAPALLSLARGIDPGGRSTVLQVLFPLSPARARELRSDVEADLRSDSLENRIGAAEWLIRLDPSSAGKVVPFLAGILNGWDVTSRSQAAGALERIGVAAKEALPALKRRVEIDEDDGVRAAARRAVEKIEKAQH